MSESSKNQQEAADGKFSPGTVVANRYLLVRLLGVGGMGSVWLAHDESLDSTCALKLIEADKRRDPEVRIRFEREAKASAQLRGMHVVDVFDHGIWEDTPYIVMEYLEGEDLGQRLARLGKLDSTATYRMLAQVARALSKAHSQGIVHRDLKPENIFLVEGEAEEIAKVLDFGIAKHEKYSLRDNTTQLGSFLGTPHYMSPEQARGDPIDGRSDLWALAVIAYQCLTGRQPFFGESLGVVLGQIMYEPLPIPTQTSDAVTERFDAWWKHASQRDPTLRFQSAYDLVDDLAEALEIESKIAVPDLPPRLSLPDGTGSYTRVSPSTPPSATQSGGHPTVDATRPGFESILDGAGANRNTERPVTRIPTPVAPLSQSAPAWRRRLGSLPVPLWVAAGALAVAASVALILTALSSPGSGGDPRPAAAGALHEGVEAQGEPDPTGSSLPVVPLEARPEAALSADADSTPDAAGSAESGEADSKDATSKDKDAGVGDPKQAAPAPVTRPRRVFRKKPEAPPQKPLFVPRSDDYGI